MPKILDGLSPASSPGYGNVVSTLDLVDNRTLPGDRQPATQDLPSSIVYDSMNGDLYVRGDTGESLTVVNGSTNTVVAEIAVPESQNPYSLQTVTVDPVGGSVYVANEGPTSNISIISGTTNEVSGSITVGGSPDAIVDDPTSSDLYVANWDSDTVNVVSTTTNALLTSVPVGTHPGAILFDPTSGQVFVANWGSGNVSVIDTHTETVVANIVTGSYPVALALDTEDDRVDVANSYNGGQGSVTVISAPVTASTHGVNISAGRDPDALAYAPNQNQMFVANGGSLNVSVIDQTTGKVVANPAVGQAPAAAVYDATSQDVYVLNSESFNITILKPSDDASTGNVTIDNYYAYGLAVDTGNGDVDAVSEGSFLVSGSPPHAQANVTVVSPSTNQPIASVPLIVYPQGMTFDPYLGQVLVADPGGNDTYQLNTTTSLIAGTRPAALLPRQSAFDSLNNEVYVVDDNDTFPYIGEVTVLNPNLREITNITLGSLPSSIAFDSANGKFYVPDKLSGDVWVLNGTTNRYNTTIPVAASAELVSAMYDPHNQEVYVGDSTTSEVMVINGTKDSVTGTIHVGLQPSSLTFDPRNNTIFVSNTGSGNVSVINDTTDLVVRSFASGYPGALAYDSANNILYSAADDAGNVAVFNASTYVSVGAAISLGSTSYPHGIVYDPENQFIYVSTEYQGSISIIPPTTYGVTFVASGLASNTPWSVTLAGDRNSSQGMEIGFQEPDGVYGWSLGSVTGYSANVTSGSVSVTGNSRTVYIGFSTTASSYSVTFLEAGLPTSSLWNVTLNGVQNHSTTNHIGFVETAGTYPFTVGRFTGYVANVTSGNVPVSTSGVTVDIGFTAVRSAFPVNFAESGLPASTAWTVTLAGSLKGSSTSTISFSEPNGSYSFSVGTVVGYSASPSSGAVDVSGAPFPQTVTFTAGTEALSVQLVANPARITLGNATSFTASTSGGVPPLSYVYAGLPGGCPTQNASLLSCTPTSTGTFNVTVTVTDEHGGSAHASATLTVAAAGGSGAGASSSPSLSSVEWGAIVAAVVAVALLILFVAWRRRHRPPNSSPSATVPPTENPPPP
jgi:YVTN family beta-propeller protein